MAFRLRSSLLRPGISVVVLERNSSIGGACSTAEITQPGYHHDLGASVFPMGIASPFFQSLPMNIPWIEPSAPCAHPLDDGTAVLLEHSIEATAANLDSSRPAEATARSSILSSAISPISPPNFSGPIQHLPQHPLLLGSLRALRTPARSIARPFAVLRRPSPCFVCRNGGPFRTSAGVSRPRPQPPSSSWLPGTPAAGPSSRRGLRR